MMNESRVDVFSVVRKLRSQRQGLFRKYVSFAKLRLCFEDVLNASTFFVGTI